jgi:hypothetical protein
LPLSCHNFTLGDQWFGRFYVFGRQRRHGLQMVSIGRASVRLAHAAPGALQTTFAFTAALYKLKV